MNCMQYPSIFYFPIPLYEFRAFDTTPWWLLINATRDREILSLRYLWLAQELIIRRFHWITRKTDPRWKTGRWKAKT